MSNTCPTCKNGTLKPGTTTVTVEREGALIIFKEVPADVCDNCGAYFLNEQISNELYEKANRAIKNGAQVEIMKLTA
ncbi:MAG: type II toxin-antitoxin system MqsA family antitoxin [Bacteroidetes bacterium]|nr:type II toxin-antitoxin system MqsA family antitoxin [Bacteroidota bacterium]MBS1930195.1 type II toxin-antitoxin system MqsA family antitoxin [Bacteroidota bacterium]